MATDKDTITTEEEYAGPQGEEGPPPSHGETIGALAGTPEDVAKEYAKTGRTPKRYIQQAARTPEESERLGLGGEVSKPQPDKEAPQADKDMPGTGATTGGGVEEKRGHRK